MTDLEKQVTDLLVKHNITFERVYEYVGCTKEMCGKMPRVIIQKQNKTPVCYHIDELIVDIEMAKIK